MTPQERERVKYLRSFTMRSHGEDYELGNLLAEALDAAEAKLAKAVAYIDARDRLEAIDRDSRNYQPARLEARKAWVEYKAAIATLKQP